uniref:Uncharacterized protein n=1 Tax=Haptolina brevifila TaxID=156173 RepID=A0A7S2NTH0_9EUKA|mmetsp:Transcript_9814/g.19995  ORF Transcript_9814/g.19995 Transcript_9814/m.19995 type:complete len:184 (+) Transcript_9814:82-633(+)
MLGAELKAYDQKVAAGEVAAPPPLPPQQPRPPSLAGLHISAQQPKVAGGRALMSQSLPSSGHVSMLGRPPKPRVRPANTPQQSLPLLELPEPSPLSSSLLSSSLLDAPLVGLQEDEAEDDVGGTSMLDMPAIGRHAAQMPCAASAPATMLWGPVGHRSMGAAQAMGGRKPSQTLLDALSAARD